jgi:hypothetical protein|tara:strand:+ start:278 stop:493 length:216 start_codon:yes stop_codon:yes gene_type:complete
MKYGKFDVHGDPAQMIDQITQKSQMAFRTREDLRRTYASLISDYTGDPVRFGSDNDFIEDLLDYGIIKEQI